MTRPSSAPRIKFPLRQRTREPMPAPVTRQGQCELCRSELPAGKTKFCDAVCKRNFEMICQSVGPALVARAMTWRRARPSGGEKSKPQSGQAFRELTFLTDEIIGRIRDGIPAYREARAAAAEGADVETGSSA